MCVVWCMNLKDNRDEKPPGLKMSKFQFCFQQEMIGIGWVGYDDCEGKKTSPTFQRALKATKAMNVDDLVWVRDPNDGVYYLGKINAKAEKAADTTCHDYDIGWFCNCTYRMVGTRELLKEYGLTYRNLISRCAVRRVKNPDVQKAAQQAWKEGKEINK